MLYWIIPLIIGIVLFCIFLYFRVSEKRVIAVVIKGLVSLMFILTGLIAWLTSKNPNSNFAIFILIGLVFGLIGDVLLDLKYIRLNKEMLYTKLGFISFGIGHIFYLTGLFINFFDFNSNPLYLILPLIVTLLLVIITLMMEKVSNIRYKSMKLYVIIYGFLLFSDMCIYLSASIQNGWTISTVSIISISLIVFTLSDLILNNTYFAPGCKGPLFIITNHALYYIAQFMIAISLFFLL